MKEKGTPAGKEKEKERRAGQHAGFNSGVRDFSASERKKGEGGKLPLYSSKGRGKKGRGTSESKSLVELGENRVMKILLQPFRKENLSAFLHARGKDAGIGGKERDAVLGWSENRRGEVRKKNLNPFRPDMLSAKKEGKEAARSNGKKIGGSKPKWHKGRKKGVEGRHVNVSGLTTTEEKERYGQKKMEKGRSTWRAATWGKPRNERSPGKQTEMPRSVRKN